ncbi:MAG: hypothetical protein M3Y81_22895, partial [Chloroflexota bacterium]|nr:hypothetical protein [Chloroflexota bacterium]
AMYRAGQANQRVKPAHARYIAQLRRGDALFPICHMNCVRAVEAQRFHHNYIGTEHLPLGLVREGEDVAAQVLRNLNVDLE